jgi:carbonic anhydrase
MIMASLLHQIGFFMHMPENGEARQAMSFPPRLCDGYRSFRNGRLATEQGRYRDLAEGGQSPETMVIGCCDSRVSPEVIFDARPGELFVVRNVANLVPPYSPDGAYHGVSAALEYAVQVLRVRHIVRGRCAGRRFHRQMDFAAGAGRPTVSPRAEAPGSYLTRLEQASILTSLDNLQLFPFVRAQCERGRLSLHGAYFDVASGELLALDSATGRFVAVTPPSASPESASC